MAVNDIADDGMINGDAGNSQIRGSDTLETVECAVKYRKDPTGEVQ